MYLDVPQLRLVVDALVHTRATTHHHKQIPYDQCRVTVTCVREGEEAIDILIPDEEVPTLGAAIGSFILWSKTLINCVTTPPMVRKSLLLLEFSYQPTHNLYFMF